MDGHTRNVCKALLATLYCIIIITHIRQPLSHTPTYYTTIALCPLYINSSRYNAIGQILIYLDELHAYKPTET